MTALLLSDLADLTRNVAAALHDWRAAGCSTASQ
jgi:hypothetical protein